MLELLSEKDRAVVASIAAARGALTSGGVTAKVPGYRPSAQAWWQGGATTETLYQTTGGLDVVLAVEGNFEGDWRQLLQVAHFGGAPAQWLPAAEQSIEDLRALPQDWNGYNAPMISGLLIDSAKEAARELAKLGVPAPQVTV